MIALSSAMFRSVEQLYRLSFLCMRSSFFQGRVQLLSVLQVEVKMALFRLCASSCRQRSLTQP